MAALLSDDRCSKLNSLGLSCPQHGRLGTWRIAPPGPQDFCETLIPDDPVPRCPESVIQHSNYSWGFRRSGTMKKFEQGATANLIELATSAASREPRIRIDIELTGILIINFTSFESIWCLQWIPTSSWRLQAVELVQDPCKFSEDAQCRRHSAHGHERNYLAIWCSLI